MTGAGTPGAAPPPATLIYLDVDDEITSAAARIRLAAADRVALVLPYGSRLATSRINFRLLAREAVDRGKQIEVICADASARALALAAGLPVHASVAAFEGRGPSGDPAAAGAGGGSRTATGPASSPERDADDDTDTRVLPVPRRSSAKVPIVGPPRPPVSTRIAVGAGIAVVLVVLVAGFLAVDLLPSATIVLHPRAERIGPLQLTVEARTDATTVDPEGLVIPARRITVDVAATATFPATGTKLVETKATGNVTFSNFDTGGANRIDAGSIVKTPAGIEFQTLATVTLPNATIEFPFTIVPSTSTVAVEALVSGPTGNVGNNEITIIPKGENRRLLQVTNKEATAGGESRQATEISQADVDGATAAIGDSLLADLDAKIAQGTGVPAGVTVFPQTHAVGEPTFVTDPATLVGTEATEFTIDATAQGTVIGVDAGVLGDLARAKLRSRVTQGWTLDADSIDPEVGTPSVAGEVVTYPVAVSATQVRDVDRLALIALIKGRILADARNLLDDYGDVEISLWPDWVSTIPNRDDRISLTVGEPRASAAPTP